MIVTVGSQKGGVGKSTLATNIITSLVLSNKTAILVDVDTQRSSSKWILYREHDPSIPSVQVHSKNLVFTLKNLNTKYDYVIVDTAGNDNDDLRSCMLISDVLLIPCRPSQTDIDTMHNMSELVDRALDHNNKLQSFIVFNLCPTNYRNKELEEAYSCIKKLTICDVAVYDRKIYRDAMSLGKSVVELNNDKAANEIKNLIEETIYA